MTMNGLKAKPDIYQTGAGQSPGAFFIPSDLEEFFLLDHSQGSGH
ncbi:hypothetical protein [Azospirillum sp.]|nr:hypothetical protein [Azospirillum sp.]HYD65911.1 hypothetical protein [Azospirillum sp.]